MSERLTDRLNALHICAVSWMEYSEYDMKCIREAAAEIERLRAALEKTNRPLTLEEIVAKQKDLVFDDHDYYEYTDGTTSLDKETGNDTD